MTRRLLYFNGLAILAVVINHAAGWGILDMIWWADRYRKVTVPNFDQINSFSFYLLETIRQFATFCVPAFLFVSGWFIAYALKDRKPQSSWKIVKTRVINLLVPYLIWSVILFIIDYLQGQVYSPLEYIRRLLTGAATPAYYFVVLLCQLYILSPLIVNLAKSQWKRLLAISILIHTGTVVLRYIELNGSNLSIFRYLISQWIFPSTLLFFVLGVISSTYMQNVKQWLEKNKWRILAFTLVTGGLTVFESVMILRTTGKDWNGPLSLPGSFYAISFIFCYLTFDLIPKPLSKFTEMLGRISYGIYLTHGKVIEFAATYTYNHLTSILPLVVLFPSLLFLIGIGITSLVINGLAQTPMRQVNRYLFG